MDNSYIKDYQINLLKNTFNNDIDRLKAINYGLDYVLNSLSHNLNSNGEKKIYNTLTTCYLNIKQIIDKSYDEESKRYCTECGKEMTNGYYNEDEFQYYCSDKCLHKNYTEEEYHELYDDGNGNFYWTEWEN